VPLLQCKVTLLISFEALFRPRSRPLATGAESRRESHPFRLGRATSFDFRSPPPRQQADDFILTDVVGQGPAIFGGIATAATGDSPLPEQSSQPDTLDKIEPGPAGQDYEVRRAATLRRLTPYGLCSWQAYKQRPAACCQNTIQGREDRSCTGSTSMFMKAAITAVTLFRMATGS